MNNYPNYPNYNGYSPDIAYQGYAAVQTDSRPIVPDPVEKKNIKKHLAGTFTFALLHNAGSFVLALVAFTMLTVMGYEFRTTADGTDIVDWVYGLAGTLPSIIMCTVLFISDKSINKYRLDDYVRTDKLSPSFLVGFLCVLGAGYLACILIQSGVMSLFALFDYSPLSEDYYTETDLTPAYLAQEFLTAVILAPICEEIMYRGVIMRRLSNVSQTYAIFVSAFFFGAMHGNLLQLILGFVIGVIFAYADLKANSLIPSIIGHMLVNLTATSSSFFEYFFNEDVADTAFMITVIVWGVIGIIALLIMIFSGKIKIPQNLKYHKNRTTPIALTCISFYLNLVLYIIFIIKAMGPLTEKMKD
ncbi:MAG: CPBP family intramembrane metalloprotease [Oscillospiraceae bacterium]|nr:CPBP family intramembrane metalloprotease [Oscillospiraceae bacterium]